MLSRYILNGLFLVAMVFTVNANANSVTVDLAQGLTPVQAGKKALNEGIAAVEIAQTLLGTGLSIEAVVETLTSLGISNQDIIAVLAALPAPADGSSGQQPPAGGWGRPPFGGHPCTNGSGNLSNGNGNGNQNGERCASPS